MTITPEQLKFRKGKLGASSYGQALGRGYGSKTRAELFHQMKGNMPPVKETMAMRVGNFMESFILSEYFQVTGRKGVEFPDTQIHPDEPRIICHCDGITEDRSRLIEIKNVGPRMHQAWDDGVPDYTWIQACGQSMVTGIMQVDVVAYFGGSELRVYELTFTKEDHAKLFDGLMDFLGYLDRDEEPPHEQADLPNLDKYYEVEDNDDSVQATKQFRLMAQRLASLKYVNKVSKENADEMKELEFYLKEYMGTRTSLLGDDEETLFTWKQGKDKTVTDWENMTVDLCDQYNIASDDYVASMERNTTTKKGNRTFLCKIKD
jgi:hypothetical protein